MDQKQYQCKWLALIGLCLLAFTAFLDATIVDTALPFIQTALNANIFQLQWVANIFTIILSMTMIAVGNLTEYFGSKKIFYFGVIIFSIAAFAAGFSPTIHILVGFRGLQALGTSIIFVTSAALLSDIFPHHQRIRAISIYTGVTGFGLMIGPLLGGILVALLDWRWIFWINLPLIAIGLIACVFSMEKCDHKKSKVSIDWRGLFFLILGLGTVMYGIVEVAQSDSLLPLALLGIGIITIALLIIFNKRQANSLFDFTIFRKELIGLTSLSCALAGVASTVFLFFDPLYLSHIRNFNPFWIGLFIAVIPSAQALIAFAFSMVAKRFAIENLLLFSVVAGWLAISLHRLFDFHTPIVFLILPFFLLGINWGLSNSTMILAVNQVIPIQKVGKSIGTIVTIWNVVGSVLLATSAALFHTAQVEDEFLIPFHRMTDLNIVFCSLILIFSARLWLKSKKI
jgi:MFS family permease